VQLHVRLSSLGDADLGEIILQERPVGFDGADAENREVGTEFLDELDHQGSHQAAARCMLLVIIFMWERFRRARATVSTVVPLVMKGEERSGT
jgi:hypothetical protein